MNWFNKQKENVMETKVKKTVRFYTSLQYEILKQQILSGKKTRTIAEEYAPVWNRDVASLRGTINSLRQKLGVNKKSKFTTGKYTNEQLDIIAEELRKNKTAAQIGKKYESAWNRKASTIANAVYAFHGNGYIKAESITKQEPAKITRVQVKEVNTTPVQEAKLVLPEGMTFEGVAKRVELHSNHFRVYF